MGRASARICEQRGLAYHLLSRKQLDIAEPDSVSAAIDSFRPWAIINTAGYVRVDDAEGDVETCRRENSSGAECLAIACASRDIRLVTFSSDLVFDGRKNAAYVESDGTSPLNVYGRSKEEAESRVLDEYPDALIIRTSAFFGPWDTFNFAASVLNSLSEGRPFAAANDLAITPTYVPDLVNATLDLLIDDEQGIWHLTNSGIVTWHQFAEMIASGAGFEASQVHGKSSQSFGFIAQRPSFSALSSERGALLPPLEESLSRYFKDSRWSRPRRPWQAEHSQ